MTSLMAQNTHIVYVSDLSGSDITDNDAPTVTFGWDGSTYEVDLTAKEAEAFYKAVKPYLDAGRKVSGTKSRGSSAKRSGPDPKVVRDWAKENNVDVPDRGRIPQSVLDLFAMR